MESATPSTTTSASPVAYIEPGLGELPPPQTTRDRKRCERDGIVVKDGGTNGVFCGYDPFLATLVSWFSDRSVRDNNEESSEGAHARCRERDQL